MPQELRVLDARAESAGRSFSQRRAPWRARHRGDFLRPAFRAGAALGSVVARR